jgi:hypothetical protein
MLNQLRNLINQFSIEAVPFDPSAFNDDLANRVSWSPVKRGGANFRTHKLVIEEPFVAKFKTTVGHLLFGLIFMIIGIGVTGWMAYAIYGDVKFDGFGSLVRLAMPLMFGGIFALGGIFTIFSALSPIRFDKQTGDFRKGRRAAKSIGPHEMEASSGYAKLNSIHALQLIKEYCRKKDSSYYSYELNLVLESGQRINVVDHGSLNRIREDAQTLGQFLGIPVWDAT